MPSSLRLLVAGAVAVPLGVLAFSGWLSFDRVRQQAERDASHTAYALSEHAHRTLRAHELLIQFVDRYTEGRDWRALGSSPEVHLMLARLATAGPDVASVFMLDGTGRTFVSSRRFPMPVIDSTDREYFRALKADDALHISAPATGRLSGDRFFTIARRRTSADGGFDGVIAVSVNPEYFEKFFASLVNPTEAASLVRSDGALLARHPSRPEQVTVLPPGSGFMRAIADAPSGGVYVTRSLTDGIERMIAYRRVGDYPVYASFQLSMSELWSTWRLGMMPLAAACLLAMALLLVGVAFAEQRTRRAAAEARSREAEQASRAKDLFVAALSHELRNPLAAIAASAEVLERTARPDSPAHASVGVISRQIVQLRRIMDDLLDTASVVHGKLRLEKRRVELGALARAELDEQLPRSSTQGAVKAAGEAWVNGDPVRLRQMLGNLIENAIKYGARRVDIELETDGDWVQASVRDDGQGLAPELLPRLFEPFVQGEQALDRAKGGLGLGLALVHRLAVQHGGTLVAESAGPGQGSTFTLRLPRAAPPARLVGDTEAQAQPRGRRLLLVEDENDARESLRALLEFGGHEVAVAADGPAGLAQVAAFAPEVALLDIGLPGMDGYELARRMRAVAPGLALVAVSGYGQVEDRERARAAGFAAHLVKPFTYEELARTLARIDLSGPEDPRQRAA
jgi:signal transduction histidine kinase/ActR/RegA family two-component response regulator